MTYEVGKPIQEQRCIHIARNICGEAKWKIGINIDARIIHKTYNHGAATGYSVMLQCKCEEQKRAKITPRDLYK